MLIHSDMALGISLLSLQVTRADVPENEALESYVMVQKDDVLEAIGTFVAAYLAELPEAQNLPPAQLQAALKTAFKVCNFAIFASIKPFWPIPHS